MMKGAIMKPSKSLKSDVKIWSVKRMFSGLEVNLRLLRTENCFITQHRISITQAKMALSH